MASVAIVAFVVLSGLLFPRRAAKIVLRAEPSRLVADGASKALLILRAQDDKGREATLRGRVTFEVFPPKGIIFLSEGQSWSSHRREVRLTLTSGIVPGLGRAVAKAEGLASDTITIETTPCYEDQDQDGFPDVAELPAETDRQRFREWFSSIADAQYYEQSDLWNSEQQDCAGLIRFAYREALKRHDREWFQHYKFLTEPGRGEVERFQYPAVPLLGTRLFRTRPGAFREADLQDSVFASFCEAKYLPVYNCISLDYDERRVQQGDLLFFFHYDDPRMPYHGMVVSGQGALGEDDWLVYHTGPVEGTRGTVKKVRLRDLRLHPEEKWRPLKSNRYFLGFYRWKIIS